MADLRRNGLTTPICVRSDGTILRGSQRVRAVRELGWDRIRAIVVEVESDEKAIEMLVEDNVHRRHMGPIAFARLADGLAKLPEFKGHHGGGDLRDEIAQRIPGVSGRTLDRYRRILKLPPALVAAVDAELVTMSAGLRIVKLPANVQGQIAQEIEAGGRADQVVARHLRRDARGEIIELRREYRRLQLIVRKRIAKLEGRLKKVAGFGLDAEQAIAVAEAACRFFKRVIAAEKKEEAQCEKRLARCLNRINGAPRKKPRAT